MNAGITEIIKQGGFALLAAVAILALYKIAASYERVLLGVTTALTSLDVHLKGNFPCALDETCKEYAPKFPARHPAHERG